jgi:hypothetical protein
MANKYYVSSAAGGSGAGTIGDPLTLAEAFSSANRGIYHIEADGTYSVSSTLTSTGSYKHFVGANSSGVVDGSRPVIQASAAIAGAMLVATGTYGSFALLDVDGNSNAETGINVEGLGPGVFSCIARNCSEYGFDTAVGVPVAYCLAHTNTGGVGAGFRLNSAPAYRCVSRDNTTGYIVQNRTATAFQCLAEGNSLDGFKNILSVDCVSIDNGGNGFDQFEPSLNCLASNNGGVGFANTWPMVYFSAYGSGAAANAGGAYSTFAAGDTIPSGVDAGTTLYRDSADTPPDYRIPSSSSLDGVGVYWPESLFGSTDNRPGIGIGDFEPAAGGGSSGSPLTSPFLRV